MDVNNMGALILWLIMLIPSVYMLKVVLDCIPDPPKQIPIRSIKYVNMFENDANNWWYKMYPTPEAAQESLTKSKLPGKVVKVIFEEV
jgi:hypothetical protein